MIEEKMTHRLYRLNAVRYVHHDGVGPLPEEVAAYARTHDGDPPAYIPLEATPTEFDVGGSGLVMWDGESAFPTEVLDYVCRNGSLPRRTTDPPEFDAE